MLLKLRKVWLAPSANKPNIRINNRVHTAAGARAERQAPRILRGLLYCTGDMAEFQKFMEKKPYLLQLVVWCLRGVARVILANNPASGALILGALLMTSPWITLLGVLGLLTSTLTAIIIGQESKEVVGGLHGFNGMLVALLMGTFSSAGDWYWWLLLPACLAGATCTFLFSGLGPVLDRWDLPVSVFPFNTAILLYLCCTGPTNPYFPHHPSTPPGRCSTATPRSTHCSGVPLLPLLCAHALLGSAAGTLAGLSVAVRSSCLYSGLSGFNGALGCMAVGGLFFTISWRTHLFSIACAFLSAYADIALSNLLGMMGVPACSWAATLTTTLMLLLTAQNLSAYRIPLGREGQGALLEESRRHGDILQWDFRESFFNLTLKELLFWHWLSRESESAHNTIGPAHPSHGSAPFILRTDDDVFVDVGGVLTLLRLLPGPSHPLYMGRAFVDTYPVRLWWIKYYVPHSLYPSGPYPPYLGGGGYLVSRETVRLFLGVSGAVPLFPIDDVYVGMCARAANVSVQHHPAFLPLEFSPALPSCAYAGALVLHKLGPQQLSQLFRELSNQSHCTASAPGL
ncbi:hypothetical protein COCON_G00113830 [Conger conger]|uniref:Uncharacterized protein n=1 Tax=Conger conger TaxID=82655 RepID=A0A9Q1DFU8_CONCO|nr:hypothetical protein COCON_G00113830 [Conger conger]